MTNSSRLIIYHFADSLNENIRVGDPGKKGGGLTKGRGFHH